MWHTLLFLLAVVYAIRWIVNFRQAARSLSNLPGYRTLLHSESNLGNFLPKIRGIVPGTNFPFIDKHSVFAWAGCDIVGHVSMFPCKADIVVADAAVIKEITTSRSRFPKEVTQYGTFSFFGPNILASEGEIWKRYRKISAPSFSERNNRLVWDEAVSIMKDLFNSGWENKKEISVDNCLDITLSFSLYVISAAGFGHKMTWKENKAIPPGHLMSFETSLYTVSTYVLQRLLLPDWAVGLTKKTREIDLGFKELRSYMIEMIEARKNSEEVKRHDLLSNLLLANASDGESEGLNADEIISNVFIFLLAGHETTAHTLCYTFALLALHPDEQEKLYQHIKSVLKDPQVPTYDEMSLLTRSMAVFNETLRMYSPATLIPKCSAEDTTLTVPNAKGETVVIPVPKGTNVFLHIPGLHYNPKYWEDPFSFNPDRFMQPNWNKDAFLPFSAGARGCLGRKFAEIEAIVAITMLVSQYKIAVQEEPCFAGETWEQKKERVLKAARVLTLTPVKVPLVFTRRS
ncbi:hypothetical protein Agabi119p4_10211 [Agaricus bisporus var. burnettii]|uniref:Cytochrome P450 n=1 Tax=Agaricus bisporus var. burnettii TaxID=192524 RepID=A0A8H7C1L5_AGABI|nr:hypothetical protein Agabi119p4_10211 [Agaricus bisporus var. burnettii]